MYSPALAPLALDAALGTADALSDPLAWLSVSLFLVGAIVAWRGHRTHAVSITGLAWGLFALFWLTMVPYFHLDAQSPLQTVLSAAAVPLSLYAGYLLVEGRHQLLTLSKAVGIMGLIYLPALLIQPVEQWLIEIVAIQSHWGMELLGYSPGVEEGLNGYESRFAFEGPSTYIVLACTGIGSISIFGGLIAAVRAPLRRKLAGFVVAASIIWVLNLARNVFVGLATPLDWFHYDPLIAVSGVLAPGTDPSFFVSHTLIAQTLSVVALIGITLLVVRIVPEILDVLEEVLYVATGSEYDLYDALDVEPTVAGPARTDGGER